MPNSFESYKFLPWSKSSHSWWCPGCAVENSACDEVRWSPRPTWLYRTGIPGRIFGFRLWRKGKILFFDYTISFNKRAHIHTKMKAQYMYFLLFRWHVQRANCSWKEKLHAREHTSLCSALTKGGSATPDLKLSGYVRWSVPSLRKPYSHQRSVAVDKYASCFQVQFSHTSQAAHWCGVLPADTCTTVKSCASSLSRSFSGHCWPTGLETLTAR